MIIFKNLNTPRLHWCTCKLMCMFFWYIWGDEFIVILTGTWSESSSAKGSCTQFNGIDLRIRMSV